MENDGKDMTDERAGPQTDRWTLIRDIAVMQVKLVADGLRDLILVPASLIAGLMSLFSSGDGNYFYRVIGVGKRTERWINLFGAYDNAPESVKRAYPDSDRGIDDIVSKVESYVVDEYQKGGVTRQAKEQFDRALDEVQRQMRKNGKPRP